MSSSCSAPIRTDRTDRQPVSTGENVAAAETSAAPAMVMGTFFVHLEIASPRGLRRRRHRHRLMSLLIGRKAPSGFFFVILFQ